MFSPDTPYITHSKDMGKLYSTVSFILCDLHLTS